MGNNRVGVNIVQQFPSVHVGISSRIRGAGLIDLTACRGEGRYMETDPCTRHTETYVIRFIVPNIQFQRMPRLLIFSK